MEPTQQQDHDSLFADLLDDAQAASEAVETLRPDNPALRDAGIYLLNEILMYPCEGWTPFEHAIDPTDLDAVSQVPTSGGVYIFVTPGQFLAYPGGGSSILYIGEASHSRGLRHRLREHSSCIQLLCNGQNDGRFYPLYEWAATYRPLVTFSAGAPETEPDVMEYELLRIFCRGVPGATRRQLALGLVTDGFTSRRTARRAFAGRSLSDVGLGASNRQHRSHAGSRQRCHQD